MRVLIQFSAFNEVNQLIIERVLIRLDSYIGQLSTITHHLLSALDKKHQTPTHKRLRSYVSLIIPSCNF